MWQDFRGTYRVGFWVGRKFVGRYYQAPATDEERRMNPKFNPPEHKAQWFW
jgi:hypothetical protein